MRGEDKVGEFGASGGGGWAGLALPGVCVWATVSWREWKLERSDARIRQKRSIQRVDEAGEQVSPSLGACVCAGDCLKEGDERSAGVFA